MLSPRKIKNIKKLLAFLESKAQESTHLLPDLAFSLSTHFLSIGLYERGS
jgi:hypothetical protein